MEKSWHIDISFIEEGDIYFFYKPRRGVERVRSIADVARFYFVLKPDTDLPPRYIVLGNKKMPYASERNETTWGFVQMVGGRGFETIREQKISKGASRPAGEGIYTIISHRDHSHLMYALELPDRIGKVQHAFNIEEEGNYIFLNRPIETSPSSPDRPFSNFSKVHTDYLNRRGTEILLVGVGADIGRLGVRAEKEQETIRSADIFSKLKVDHKRHPIDSLISGDWV